MFQVEDTSLVYYETERKVSLMGRESQFIQGFVDQEKEFEIYSKETLEGNEKSSLTKGCGRGGDQS